MKIPRLFLFTLAALASARAGEPPAITTPQAKSRWSLGLSFAPTLNVRADFSGTGGFASPFTPQPLGGGQDNQYDDGYVGVDASGNNGGLTYYWGYDNASQYDPSGSGSMSFNITNSLRTDRVGETEGMSPGFELFAYYEMGTIAEISGRPVTWGLKGTLNYTSISISSSRSLTSDILRVTDNYDLGGAIPASPGYAGTSGGPGVLLGDDPGRSISVISDGAFIQGRRDLDVDMLSFGFGSYIDVPVTDRFSVKAEAGVNVAIAHGEYDFSSSTTVTGVGTQGSSGDDSRTMLLPGAYAGVTAVWQLTEDFGLYGSARYQYFDNYGVNAGGSQGALDFDGAAVISIGGVLTF
jgi:hypothetical protein